ncbi:MAG: hypothetical protein ACXW4I_11165, partial [Candidatus Deferrimicrobiaceae bacterium]
VDCAECRWCHEFARKAIRIDETARARALEAYDAVFQALHDGSMWRYFPGKESEAAPGCPRPSLAGAGNDGDGDG